MNAKMKYFLFAAMLFLVPIAKAASVSIDSTYYAIEGMSLDINVSINSPPFSGAIYITYNNINSTTSSASFSATSFTEGFYNLTIAAKANATGPYSIFANVTNSSSETVAMFNKTGMVNSSMPKILSSFPSGIVSKDSTFMAIRTNEPSTCKYSTSNATYDNLSNVFSNTGGTEHNQSLTSLSQQEYAYYVRCRDVNGYAMNESFIIRFTIDLPPSAQIELSDPTPVKEGTIEIILTTSESLENAPTLEYSLNDAPSVKKPISLTGSGSGWKGYLIISKEDHNKIGAFYFSAVDNVGNTGTKISSGNVFVIDTEKPVAPKSLKASPENDGDIKISWYYDGEEADHFRVYRATAPGINYVDFYADSDNADSNNSQHFVDRASSNKVTYYYKVSAVDNAGNEGPLSAEVYATALNKEAASSPAVEQETQEEEEPQVLPPELVPEVDAYITRADKLLIDVKDIKNELGSEQGEKREIIREFNIMAQLESANSRLEELKSRLEDMKSHYAAQGELSQKLNAVELEIKKLEKITPKDIGLLEKSNFFQAVSREDIEKAASELLKGASFTDEEKASYVSKNDKEKNNIKTEVFVKIISMRMLDGTRSEKSVIKKKLSYSKTTNLTDVVVMETIPKTIAENANEIEFLTDKYEVMQEDPIIKFGFLNFDFAGQEIAYIINKRISIDDLKETKSVVLLSFNSLVKEPGKLSGYSIFSATKLGLSGAQSLFVWIGMTAIAVLGTYYLFFVKNYGHIAKKAKRLFTIRRMNADIRDNTENELGTLPIPELPDRNPEYEISGSAVLNELSYMKEVKADFADSLLPMFVALNDRMKSGNPARASGENFRTTMFYINSLIDKAHSNIDNGMHHEAVRLYPKIEFLYQNLPKEHRSRVYSRCAQLHSRITNLNPIVR